MRYVQGRPLRWSFFAGIFFWMRGTYMYKKNRLSLREDFQKVYKFGKSTANQQFVVYQLLKPSQLELRLGVSVSKKLGNAVVRNRLRRMMKEIVRLHLSELENKFDIIILARKPSSEMDYVAMEKSLLHVLKRSGLIKQVKRE